jgi:hypothetical protein
VKNCIACAIAIAVLASPLYAQSHVSVALDAEVYRVLELAEARGLCKPLPGVKPYSRATVIKAIDQILDSEGSGESDGVSGKSRRGALTEMERRILIDIQETYRNVEQDGWDTNRGAYHIRSADIGAQIDTIASVGFYPNAKGAGENWLSVFIRGDIGLSLSYAYQMTGSPFIYAEREIIGSYHTYYNGFPSETDADKNNIDQTIVTYGKPLGYFPYAYKKRWDSSIWSWQKVNNSEAVGWPEDISIGYLIRAELDGSLFDDRLSFRFGRIDREWGAMSAGSSLILNQAAYPFMAIDSTFKLFDELRLSSITGILEYDAMRGFTDNSFQNAFSLTMLEFDYKNYFHIDFGSTSVWAKRFELGYLFPDPVAFLYQGTIGDYDNVAAFLNLKGTVPGIGKLWLSLLLDEINFEKDIFELDRAMYVWQAGIAAPFPILPFTQVKLSYTKVEPYAYTHTRDLMPWYGSLPMERAYVNGGAGLGYYLPPNADELLLRFDAMPAAKTQIHAQYQMIRHGADHGPQAVDGSSLFSELAPANRSENPLLRKYFLYDGAYQWTHILKIGLSRTFAQKGTVPVRLFAEAGIVLSYYTAIDGPANSGRSSPYKTIDTLDYPQSTAFIATVGIRIFP